MRQPTPSSISLCFPPTKIQKMNELMAKTAFKIQLNQLMPVRLPRIQTLYRMPLICYYIFLYKNIYWIMDLFPQMCLLILKIKTNYPVRILIFFCVR